MRRSQLKKRSVKKVVSVKEKISSEKGHFKEGIGQGKGLS